MASHLSNEEFFTKLGELFKLNEQKGHGTVYLTQKRLTFTNDPGADTPMKAADDSLWDLHPPHSLPILIRATNGKTKEQRADKIKISTIVQPDALDGFFAQYAETCKAGMTALKKRDRSKKKKSKAKKKKGGADGETKG